MEGMEWVPEGALEIPAAFIRDGGRSSGSAHIHGICVLESLQTTNPSRSRIRQLRRPNAGDKLVIAVCSFVIIILIILNSFIICSASSTTPSSPLSGATCTAIDAEGRLPGRNYFIARITNRGYAVTVNVHKFKFILEQSG